MAQDILMLVEIFRNLPLLIRGFHAILTERHLFSKKKALSALIPAIAGLATIAVESLNSFIQRKRNKAMASSLKKK